MITVGLTVFKTWALDALSQIHPFNILSQQLMAPILLGIKTQTLAVMFDFSFLSLTLRTPCQQILLAQLSDISRIRPLCTTNTVPILVQATPCSPRLFALAI